MWKKKKFIAKPPGKIRMFARTMKLLFFFIFAEIQTIAFYQICFNLFMQNL